MRRSEQRILTTHTGSLFRPPDLLDMIDARGRGETVDRVAFEVRLHEAVDDIVAKQRESGIDIVDDGEQSKPNFVEFVAERLNGMEGHNSDPVFKNRRLDFPDFYAERGNTAIGRSPLCVGPLSWKDRAALELDIANLLAAMDKAGAEEGFLPSPSPGIISMRIPNAYYPSEEEYLRALASVMHEEYQAIADAGLIVQIDGPDVPLAWTVEFEAERLEDYRHTVALRHEALNEALTGIPEESVRYHVCWGNGENPHTLDIELKEILDLVLQVNAQGYSIEAANPRHGHEWALWREVRLPDGKVLIPGVIDSTTNFVEHPELIAQRIQQFADLVGPENVIAGADCGFGTFAGPRPRVHPQVVWAKFSAMAEGARIASARLFH